MVARGAGRGEADGPAGSAPGLGARGDAGWRRQAVAGVADAGATFEVEANTADTGATAAVAIGGVAIVAELGGVEDAIAAEVGFASEERAGIVTDDARSLAVVALLSEKISVVALFIEVQKDAVAAGSRRAGGRAKVGVYEIAIVAALAALGDAVAADSGSTEIVRGTGRTRVAVA